MGAGITGRSIARFLRSQDLPFDWFDTRSQLENQSELAKEFPHHPVRLGPLDADSLKGYSELLLSPGISRQLEAIRSAQLAGADITSDIDLFAQENTASVAAITGSNGKSTVTAMLAHVASQCGRNAIAAGNIGVPVLDLVHSDYDLFVLELSSFQLEITLKLKPDVAVILNLSADHMDRYANLASYHAAKQRIYQGAKAIVCNRDDDLTRPLIASQQRLITFGLDAPDLAHYGVRSLDGEAFLCRGLNKLVNCSELPLQGSHNISNALAVLAMAEILGLDPLAAAAALSSFTGLPHRCQRVASSDDILWINDSKATNIGATLAAVVGLKNDRKLVLIAGGQGKGQNFSELVAGLTGSVHSVLLIGEDAEAIEQALSGHVASKRCLNLHEAVVSAKSLVEAGDTVLLSPACASFDMFSGYADRGNQFAAIVQGLQS